MQKFHWQIPNPRKRNIIYQTECYVEHVLKVFSDVLGNVHSINFFKVLVLLFSDKQHWLNEYELWDAMAGICCNIIDGFFPQAQ